MSDPDTSEPPMKRQKSEPPLSPTLSPKQEIMEDVKDFTADIDMSMGDNFSLDEDKYNNYVSPSELEKLREFKVLDEVKSDDDNSNDGCSDSSDGKSEIPEEEIEKMLEEDLPEGFKGAPKPKDKAYVTTQKIVLEEKGVNQFEVLPLDWMMARHYSGIPVYVHRTTRVCTLSKPYFLGNGNTRRHDIPISAIPCLAYRKALEEEEKQQEIDKEIQEKIKNGTWKNINTSNANKPNSVCNTSVINAVNIEKQSKCPFNNGKRKNETKLAKDSSDNKNDETENRKILNNDTNELVETDESSQKVNDADARPLGDSTAHIHESFSMTNYTEANKVAPKRRINLDRIIDDKSTDSNETSTAVDPNSETKEDKASKHDNDESNVVSDNNTQETTPVPCANGEIAESQGITGETDEPKQPEEIPLNRQPVVLPGGEVMPPPRVETVSTSWKTQHLTAEQVNDYCKKLFKFKTISIMHFMSWADRRKYTKARKARKALQYPTLPDGTKLITIPATPAGGHENGGKSNKRDWVMNMNGRSYLSVFHEYVKRALQKQPVYEFKQLENASTPYQATVYIGGMQYGVGHGSSKRSAKSAAARASIHILIPEMRAELEQGDQPASATNEPDFSFFDYVGIEDPRITEFCAATCEPSPHAILRTCLLRNFGAADKQIQTEMKKLEYQKIELTMKVGKHSATVVCKNKKTAKQRASQAILQALHPHVRSWGSLLRLYGSRSVKSCKEKKLEEQQITLLQDAARHNEPNYAVLEKLRNEMRKLRERDEAVVPIGTLLVKDDLPTHSGSNLNNVDL